MSDPPTQEDVEAAFLAELDSKIGSGLASPWSRLEWTCAQIVIEFMLKHYKVENERD